MPVHIIIHGVHVYVIQRWIPYLESKLVHCKTFKPQPGETNLECNGLFDIVGV